MNKNEESIFSCLTIRDPEQAFQNAIKKGLKNPDDYMYMHSAEGKDFFKHIDTRSYISFDINDKISFKDILKKLSIRDRINKIKDMAKSRTDAKNSINKDPER
ncbi:MAG: hypothetical protein GX660_03080 [Clostridiaceae bacterium]|nr:hypothetical protein [Clostridiaceae bacterium]